MSLIFESLLSSLPSLLSLSDFHNGFPAAAAMIDVSTEFNHFDRSGELVCVQLNTMTATHSSVIVIVIIYTTVL